MASEEALTIDGLAVNDGITFGMLDFLAPVPRQRRDWVGAADSEAELLVRDPLHENRTITARINVVQQASMDLAHDKLLLILDKLQKASKYTDGIAMTWTPATGTRTATFDLLAGEITDLPVDWESGYLANSPTLTIEMTCKPYWRGTETLTSTTSASAPFVTLEVAGVTGDVPARGRLIVTDTATQSRRHVEWGLEGPLTYNSGTSLLLDSDSLVTSGFGGTGGTFTGAYDPNGTGNSVISTSVYDQPQAVAGTGALSHVGVFRVKARVNNGSNPAGIYWRLAWRVGDGPYTTNDPASTTIPGWVELDLGTVTIPTVLSGTQSWDGRVEAYKPGSTDVVILDYLTLIPVKDGYGKARAAYSYTPGVVSAFDQFTAATAGNNLNGRTAPAGGTWATSGSTTDFQFADDLSDEQIKRSTTGDASARFAILGSTNYADTQVDVRVQRNVGVADGYVEQGAIARWTDSSNYLRATLKRTASPDELTFQIVQRVAGTDTTLATSTLSISNSAGSFYFVVRLIVYTSGRVIATVINSAQTAVAEIEASTSALATGGTLASGKPGIFDIATTTFPTVSRYYDNFAAGTPASEPIAVYSGRNMQIRYDDVIRQNSGGTTVGRPRSYRGSRFLLPVGTSRVLVKARRNDIEAAADDNVTDALQIQVGWTPRGLAVPR